jgi:hypothetical protein
VLVAHPRLGLDRQLAAAEGDDLQDPEEPFPQDEAGDRLQEVDDAP